MGLVQDREATARHKITATTPRGAANQLLRAIKTMPGGEGAFIRKSDYGNAPTVVWEAGPYEWAIIASGKGDIYGEELGGTLTDAYWRNRPTFALHGQDGWYAEPMTSYALSFVRVLKYYRPI